jgi:hypothetical protein
LAYKVKGEQASKRARERKVRDLVRKKGLETGGFNVPYLLAIKANTHLDVGIGKRWCSYTNAKNFACCTSPGTKATTDIGMSVASLITTQFRHL